MGTEWHTLTAMDADKGLGSGVKVNSVNRAGCGTFSTLYAEFPFNKHPSAFALEKGTCRAGKGTRRWIAGKTRL
jgi:hypothetical protein